MTVKHFYLSEMAQFKVGVLELSSLFLLHLCQKGSFVSNKRKFDCYRSPMH